MSEVQEWEVEDDFSLSEGIQSLMNSNGGSNDILSLLGGQLDIKSMLPQIMLSLLGRQSRGGDITRLMSEMGNMGNYSMDNSFLNHHKEYDEQIKIRGMGQLKGAIPYLDPSLQRHFAVYIKLIELQNIVDYYTKNTLPYVVRDENWQRDMLMSMGHFSGNNKQYDSLLKMMDMYKLAQNFGGVKWN